MGCTTSTTTHTRITTSTTTHVDSHDAAFLITILDICTDIMLTALATTTTSMFTKTLTSVHYHTFIQHLLLNVRLLGFLRDQRDVRKQLTKLCL